MRYQAYPKYRDSGVDWLGEVPKHWEVKRLKFVFPRLYSGVSVNSDNVPTDQESPGVLKTSCVYGNRFHPGENKRVLDDEIDRVACPVTSDSLIVSRMNTPDLVGNCGYVESDYPNLFLPDRLWIARFTNHVPMQGKFAWYLVSSDVFVKLTGILATGTSGSMKNLTQDAFLNIAAAFPPVAEQTAIVDFLDRETGRIDTLLAKKRALIGLLKEKRSTLISHTVTRGLPAAVAREFGLDEPHTHFKDSGIDWLGEVPEGWEVKNVKHITRILRGKFSHRPRNDSRMYDGVYPFIQTGDIAAAKKYVCEYHQTLSEDGFGVSKQFPRGTLVMTIAANIGDIAILDFEACFPDSIVGFVPKSEVNLDFLYLLFTGMKPVLLSTAILNTQLNLNIDRIGSLKAGLPPLPEQTAIAAYLDRETAKIDSLGAKVEAAIERLREYRTALITAAVTGKIDVREV